MELAAEDKKRKLQAQRLEHARKGIAAFKLRKIGDAVRSFQNYLRTLEEIKGAVEGGLNPSHFDIKNEQQELLMVSGIYSNSVRLNINNHRPLIFMCEVQCNFDSPLKDANVLCFQKNIPSVGIFYPLQKGFTRS